MVNVFKISQKQSSSKYWNNNNLCQNFEPDLRIYRPIKAHRSCVLKILINNLVIMHT